MNIENMTITEIDARMAEIATEMDKDGADIDALTEEVRKMNERNEALKAEAEKRKALRNAVSAGKGETIRTFEKEERKAVEYDAASPEYRRAFMKNLLGEEMTAEERAAWVHTTANTTAVLPTTMLNNIWDLVSSQHSIMGDITIYRTGTIIEVVKHTAIAQGNAATVNENAANDDEKNTFVKLYGLDRCRRMIEDETALAVAALEPFQNAALLSELADRMATREF
jgi:HK97 family phage major capsid protein